MDGLAGGRQERALFDDRPSLTCSTGIGRYAATLARLLRQSPHAESVVCASDLVPTFAGPYEAELLLPALLEREGVDLLHSPLFLLPGALAPEVATVVTIHDAIPVLHPELSSPAFVELFCREAPAAARRASLVVCPSEHARAEVAAALGVPAAKLRVLPEAPAPVFRPGSIEEVEAACARHGLASGRYLLSVGGLERRKAPDLILDALALLRGRAPDLLVAFAGPEGDFQLAEEAQRRGVGDAVRGLGRVPDEELAALYSGALALVFPSRHEGFGLPVVEAFACGTPVVAARATSLPEVCGEAALLCAPEDPEALSEAVLQLMDDAALREALEARGTARLQERFTDAHVHRALMALYAELGARRAVAA